MAIDIMVTDRHKTVRFVLSWYHDDKSYIDKDAFRYKQA